MYGSYCFLGVTVILKLMCYCAIVFWEILSHRNYNSTGITVKSKFLWYGSSCITGDAA